MITIEQISTKDTYYTAEQGLRNEVLLRPIGIPDHAWEMHDEASWHFVAIEQEQVIGCVVLRPLDAKNTKAQLMQMAVASEQQGKGIGKLLVQDLLRFSETTGIQEIICHARDNAVAFYLRQGFEIYDEAFEEVGILHRHMHIRLV